MLADAQGPPAGPALEWERPPSAAAYMAYAMLRGQRRAAPPPVFPALRARWRGFALASSPREAVGRITGLPAGPGLDLVLPQFTGFRALMALLTHRSFPLPIWRALQIRSALTLHRPLPAAGALELEAGVAGQRILEKGVEVDLRAVVRAVGSDEVAWEGTTTFYYRGRFGPGGLAPAASRPPAVSGPELARWRTSPGGGWRVGRLTGDYNPLHWWPGHARRRGFAGAFHHPQVVLGQCLARLPVPAPPLRLDAWVRGQFYEGAEVALRAAEDGAGTVFSASPAAEPRPALVGLLRAP